MQEENIREVRQQLQAIEGKSQGYGREADLLLRMVRQLLQENICVDEQNQELRA
jgi:hypothetical protein